MIDSSLLLDDLRKLLRVLETDLRERCQTEDAINAPVLSEYQAARRSGRTVEAFESWREEYLTQVGVAWLLGCVFVRFLEDNGLIDPMISGPGDRMGLARDARDSYFKQHQLESDRDYLVSAFRKIEKLPSGAQLFDERHNPLWRVPISGDAASKVLDLWRNLDPESGQLVHDFSDPNWDTRFLGDLYQDLSEEARSKYALLQTPVFVEEFILDRTLTPAIDEFGFNEVRLIDPTCGSGHFLLGAFARLLALWQRYEPGTNVRALVQRALDQVYGVDLNPYATAIARFRLLLTALRASEVARLNQAPSFRINLATGDSLLHGRRFTGDYTLQQPLPSSPYRHLYEAEDGSALERILGQQYHAVVGNPPYIAVNDKALRNIYRSRYESCYGRFTLVPPFIERFFELALQGDDRRPAGLIGMIVSNAFMKREFGIKLVEKFIPNWDLTHVIDTAGAFIPGHGTPTAIVFGRNRRPLLSTVRTVMGIRGEPQTPDEPSKGKVWTAILNQIDKPGSHSDFVSVTDTLRETLHSHPWSLGGGGAAELKEALEIDATQTLSSQTSSIGITAVTGEDDFYIFPTGRDLERIAITAHQPLLVGGKIRDWSISRPDVALWPYGEDFHLVPFEQQSDGAYQLLWRYKNRLNRRKRFGTPMLERGLTWYEWQELYADKLRTPLSIVFAGIASHNHFVLHRGGAVFAQSAPLLKLAPQATQDDHLLILGLLNSSTACFWLKQVSQQKQLTGGDGVRVEARSKVPYEFTSRHLEKLPLPVAFGEGELSNKLLNLARLADTAAEELSALTAVRAIEESLRGGSRTMQSTWNSFQENRSSLRSKLVLLQEEIDFTVYRMYGLCDDSVLSQASLPVPVGFDAGQRAFEILSGENQESFPVPKEIPSEWPTEVREVWLKRIGAIQNSPELRLIEDPQYKRRWIGRQGLFNWSAKTDEFRNALRDWLLDRLESKEHWPRIELTSCARLAESVANDPDFMRVAELYRTRPDFDLPALILELVEAELIPYLPEQLYKGSGLRKRALWERIWDMQRNEDAIQGRTQLPESDSKRLTQEQAAQLKAREVGDIPVPPRYKTGDFVKGSYWSLRGPVDVPKERFIAYPGCGRRGDPTLVIGWAGWNHLQRAQALAAWYEGARKEGWSPDQLKPMLVGLVELLPWLRQWYNELNPEYGLKMGDFFGDYLDQQLLALDLGQEDLRKTINETD